MKKPLLLFLLYLFSFFTARSQADPNYFPIAVWLQGPHNAQAYKNAGINLFIGVWNGLDQTKLNTFKNAGMRFICDQNTFALSKLSDTLIYGWMHGDEPDNAQWNANTQQYDPCVSPSVIINDYNAIKAKDPSRPVYLNLGRGVSLTDWIGRGTCTGKTEMYPDYKNGYVKGCDIVSYDIYPVNSSEAKVKNNLWYVPKGVDSLKIWSSGKRPVWCWIETTLIDSTFAGARKPTPLEVKAEVWMALIHGATGFGYFCHSWYPSFRETALLQDAAMLAEVKKINAQVTSLAPVLHSPSTNGYANVNSSNTAVPIDFMTKSYGGANYIFAVAMRNASTTATFTVSSGTSVEVLGENRTIPVTGGKFSDNFSGWGVHLYKITTGTSVPEIHNAPVFRITPNPFCSSAIIEISPLAGYPCNLVIYDLRGRMVFNTEVHDRKIILDRKCIQKGMYLCSLKNKEGRILATEKLIVTDNK